MCTVMCKAGEISRGIIMLRFMSANPNCGCGLFFDRRSGDICVLKTNVYTLIKIRRWRGQFWLTLSIVQTGKNKSFLSNNKTEKLMPAVMGKTTVSWSKPSFENFFFRFFGFVSLVSFRWFRRNTKQCFVFYNKIKIKEW